MVVTNDPESICNMILGPTTAAELHADTAPYRDVPVTSDFAGYIRPAHIPCLAGPYLLRIGAALRFA